MKEDFGKRWASALLKKVRRILGVSPESDNIKQQKNLFILTRSIWTGREGMCYTLRHK